MAQSNIKQSRISTSNSPRMLGHSSPSGSKMKGGSGKGFGGHLYGTKSKKLHSPSAVTADGSSSDTAGNEGEDNDDSNEEDDEADQPAGFAPSYGCRKRHQSLKTGLPKQRLVLSKHGNKLKIGPARSRIEYDFDDISSVSSVSGDDAIDSTKSDDSDDDAYQGVDDVSDEDDEDVEKQEEELILESEYERDLGSQASSLRSANDWLGLDDLEHRPLYSGGSFFENDDHPLLQSELHDVVVEAELDAASLETPMPRRVHFETTDDSSDSDRTTEDDDEYPDFLQQDSLDPDFRQMIENDCEAARRPHSPHELFVDADFYDIPGNIYHVESDTTSVGSSSGYETEGETTDEEDHPPPATITHPRSILRRESSASLTPECEASTQNSKSFRRRGPFRGTFIADPHKPVAVVAPNGRQLILIPPYASSRHDWLESATQSTSPTDESPRTSGSMANAVDDSDTDRLVTLARRGSTPMLSSAANLMMSAMQNNSGGQVMGPPEAFYPTRRRTPDHSFDEDDDDDDDSEAMLNVEDFIDFGNKSSDDEDMPMGLGDAFCLTSPIVSSSAPGSLAPTPSRPVDTPHANHAEKLLDHLDRGIVTAFRRNHNRYQALIRLPPHREFVSANSPSRPASAFRRSKLSAPRTPTRKRQASSYLGGEAVRRKLSSHHLGKASF